MTRRWYEALPNPYKTEKQILAVVIPLDWPLMEGVTIDGAHKVMVARSLDGTELLGLQVIDSKLKKRNEHREIFAENGTRMADAEYVGPISTLPQSLLMDENVTVLLFCRDEMWRKPIDLKRAWRKAPASC